MRLAQHRLDAVGVKLGVVDRDLFLGASAQEFEHRLARQLAHQIPDRQVNCADRCHADALAAPSMAAAIHLFPDMGVVERVFADHQGCEPVIDGFFHHGGGEGCIADADGAVIGFHLAGQPLMEPERRHRIAARPQRVRRIGTEIPLWRNGGAGPVPNTGADRADLGHVVFTPERGAAGSDRGRTGASPWI